MDKVNPGYGYRSVPFSEVTHNDEVNRGDGLWISAMAVAGRTISQNFQYRRVIDPGDGWEIVPKNETAVSPVEVTLNGVNWGEWLEFRTPAEEMRDFKDYGILAFRRRKVAKAQEPPRREIFIVQPRGPLCFETEQGAINSARSMAEKHPGVAYDVVRVVRCYQCDKPEVKEVML